VGRRLEERMNRAMNQADLADFEFVEAAHGKTL
jgi:hypothetical protein